MNTDRVDDVEDDELKIEFDIDTIRDLWDNYSPDDWYRLSRYQRRDRFIEYLRTLLVDPTDTDLLGWCRDCREPGCEDDMHRLSGEGSHVCEGCRENYSECNDCEMLMRHGTWTQYDYAVCDSCLGNGYSYCEECDLYYANNDDNDHSHRGCDCEAPAQQFMIRNDGEAPLANDTRVKIQLPAGTISAEGMGEISLLLRDHRATIVREGAYSDKAYNEGHPWSLLSYTLEEIGTEWQTKDGNFTKRFSRHAYKKHGLKIPPEMLSKIGNIGSAHSTAVDFQVETTRNLNMSAADFYHEDSCWWQSYSESRCALKNNGGFGLRTFTAHGYVSGRAWVMPLRKDEDGQLVPTFETENPDAMIVFNGYGDLSGYAPARIMAHMSGMTYRKVRFMCSPMYINNEGGYLIAPEEIAQNYTDGSLILDTDSHANLYHSEQKELINA